jgi:Subtilase family
MARRAFIHFLAILLIGSWTGPHAGYFSFSTPEAQAKAGGNGKGGGGRGGSGRSGGGSKSSGSKGDKGGGRGSASGNGGHHNSGKAKGHSQNANRATTKSAKQKTSPKTTAAGPVGQRAQGVKVERKKSAPGPSWASQIQRLDSRGQTPTRTASREIVVSSTDPRAVAGLTAAGIRPIAVKQIAGATLFKLGLPQGLSPAAALRFVSAQVPGAVASRNDLYYPTEHSPEHSLCADCVPEPSPAPVSACTTKVTIGLIDTQVDLAHRALKGQDVRILKSREGAGSSTEHGTSVAALLVGKAPDGSVGLVPGATLLATDAFASDANGDFTDAFALAAALDTLVAAGADVINLSLAGPSNEILQEAVARAVGQGVDVVASVGNSSGMDRAYPAAYPDVISVTAVDTHNDIYRYANRGTFVDFAAPGVSVSIPGSDLVPVSGTSFATPSVTAAAAVLRSTDAEREMSVEERLEKTAIDLGAPGRDEVFGWGMIDLASVCPAEAPVARTSLKNLSPPE